MRVVRQVIREAFFRTFIDDKSKKKELIGRFMVKRDTVTIRYGILCSKKKWLWRSFFRSML